MSGEAYCSECGIKERYGIGTYCPREKYTAPGVPHRWVLPQPVMYYSKDGDISILRPQCREPGELDDLFCLRPAGHEGKCGDGHYFWTLEDRK